MTDGADERRALERLLEKAPAAGLSASEIEALREVLRAYEGWQALGRGVRALVVTLAAVAAAVAAWDVLVARVKAWLAG